MTASICHGGWAPITSGVRIVTLSVVGASAFDRDDAVRFDRIALFNLAGNCNPSSGTCDTTTCRSPNVICVGNWDYVNAQMHPFSNWTNWPGTDREQPDLVAPGTNLRGFQSNGVYGNISSGTSWATPMAASVAVLLHDVTKTSGHGALYYPSFDLYPELTKAVMMAGATTNVQGGPISDQNAPDDRDGAGGIDVESIQRIYNGFRWTMQYKTPADGTSPLLKSVYLTAGQTLRAYMVWSRCPSNNVADLHASLDLRLKSPAGAWIPAAFGDSNDQTYEAFRYTVPTTGTYTMHMQRWSMASCGGTTGEYVALAYDIE